MRRRFPRQSTIMLLAVLWLCSFVGVELLHSALPHPADAEHHSAPSCPICLVLRQSAPATPAVNTVALAARPPGITLFVAFATKRQSHPAAIVDAVAPRGPPV